MLVRYYQELAHPAYAVEAALTRDPDAWLPGLVRASHGRGMELVSRVGLTLGPGRVDHEVRMSISLPHHVGQTAVIPIAWIPTGGGSVVPALEGELEVSPLDGGRSQLAMNASYRPPLGWLGAVAERALMRRVAEATLKDFVDHVAHGVDSILAADGDPRSSG